MPTTNTIQPAPLAPAALTESERIAKQLLGDSDLALNRLASAVQTSFELLWGTKENPRSKEDAQASLVALGANVTPLFARHAAIVAFLATEGLVTFEDWEIVPAYVVGEDFTLGDLSPEWV